MWSTIENSISPKFVQRRDIIVNLRHLRNAVKYYFGKAEKQKKKDSQTNKKRWPGMKLKRFENHEAEKKP